MIKNISIHNFKVFKKLDNVRLNKITLIGGKNNSGKSSLLEAIFLYLGHKNLYLISAILGWRGLYPTLLTPETLWAPFFYRFSLPLSEIVIETTEDSGTIGELSVIPQDNYTPKIPLQMFPVNGNGFVPILNGGSNLKALSFCHKKIEKTGNSNVDFIGYSILQNNNVFSEIEQNNDGKFPIIFFLGSTTLYDLGNVERLGKLDKNDEQDKILNLLREFEPELQRFQVIKEGINDVIYADFGKKHKIPINLLGDGFCRCFTIALLLVADNIDVLFLDEFGIGVHYSMLNTLWQFIIEVSDKLNCQIIATTHSYEMIQAFYNAINEKEYDDAGYIRLQKKNDEIIAHQYNKDDLYDALSTNWEVR
jgi:ABC-type cobalamin/Fe3+-siderophores transport system ATPase subunit